jgi:uncharacterized RDD family membrane protein YckC
VIPGGARRERDLLTPEGVPLRFTLAGAGDRLAAFLIDLTFLSIASAALGIAMVTVLTGRGAFDHLVVAAILLASFLLRSFYFIWFEIRWHGTTPGKRLLGIRVIDASGGPLTPQAVVARNLLRDVEFFLPVSLIAAPQMVWPGSPAWAGELAALWAVALGLLPLFNSDRLRPGDLLGGTLVVLAPRVLLLDDLGAHAVAEAALPRRAAHAFTDAQLDVYGIYELQTLEAVLRRGASEANRGALAAVAERIQRKIAWEASSKSEPYWFLRDFYAALRARLESRMLLGKRRESKAPAPR